MPLFELYRMAKEKLDSSGEKNPLSTDLSSAPENDFLELVWDNGQVLTQGQSSRSRKNPTSNSLSSHYLPSHIPKTIDRDIGNGNSIAKMGKLGVMDSVFDEISMPVHPSETGLSRDDDMVPWLNYPVDESLQQGYCSDFLPELTGISVSELSSLNNNASFERSSSNNHSIRNSHTVVSVHSGARLGQGNVPKVSATGSGDTITPIGSPTQLYPSASQPWQASLNQFRSRVSNNIGDNMNTTNHRAVCGDSIQVPPWEGGFHSGRTHTQDLVPLSSNPRVVNFSHFSRPATLTRVNHQNVSATSGLGLAGTERIGSKGKGSETSGSNPTEFNLIDLSSGLREELGSHSKAVLVPSKFDAKAPEAKPPSETPEGICHEDVPENGKSPGQIFGESATKGSCDGEKAIEPAVASSSVCSGNSVERALDDHTHNLKRKHRDNEESEGPSEDIEEESVGVKKTNSAKGTGSKRSRAAEVHNLSERRRRDRINEKMRALQELIPNCNKVDKASMLDEAIEYLKTLQLQVQIMSMGAGFYMPPMMLPAGMQHMHAPPHFAPMGVGMGMGMGMGMGFGLGMLDLNGGSSGCPMIPVPPMHGTRYPGPPLSGPAGLHGMSGSSLPLFGHPSQGIPMSMPRAPFPLSGGPPMKSVGPNASGISGVIDNLDSAPTSSPKDQLQSTSSRVTQNGGANGSLNQTSGQATNGDGSQASEVTGSGAFKLSDGNHNVSNGDACEYFIENHISFISDTTALIILDVAYAGYE